MEENQVYIRIEDPAGVRRSLLESLKANIHCLQKSENLRELRLKKQAEMASFKNLTNEIHDMVAEIRKDLPRIKVKRQQTKPVVAPKAEKTAKPAEPVHHKRLTEVDRLERDLHAIEEKLSSLQ